MHKQYMQRCLLLAKQGAGQVAPNPMVGAVLVHEGRIIGEGYHEHYGEAHAEVHCVNSVQPRDQTLISQSTMYVSLEPCVHFGKTPPCADLIIKSKIPRVVIGCRDSFTEVDGRGIEKLKEAGIEVATGVLEKESLDLNKRFFTFHTCRRPYIILKWAQSNDGKIAGTGPARTMISNDLTRRLVHKWRSEEAAILVGTNTALQDDPELTTRLWPGKNPLRLVIDKGLTLPGRLKLLNGSTPTIVFNHLLQEERPGLFYLQLKTDEDLLQQILATLYTRGIQSMMVEGGAMLLQSFIDAGLWDEARVLCNEQLTIGEGLLAPVLKNNLLTGEEKMGTDRISFFINRMNSST